MLQVENLNVYYGAIHALQGITFNVDEGEIVTLIGANGAGKSTTLRTISGLLRSRTGSVSFKGQDISAVAAEKIVQMGISHVPEGRKIFAPLSVRENLMMGAYTRNDQAEIAQTLERVYKSFPRLKERATQYGGTLSGGEQQMLATGRGLMSQPTLLLLDEPSMGLSPILVEEIFRIIVEINKQGTSILLVEQNAQMALSIASRAYVLETGRIVLSGSAKEIADNSQVKAAYLGIVGTGGGFLLFLVLAAGRHEPRKIVDILDHDLVRVKLDSSLRHEMVQDLAALARRGFPPSGTRLPPCSSAPPSPWMRYPGTASLSA